MSKKIKPVDRYELRKAIITMPGTYVCGKGYCISVEDLNKAIDDMNTLPIDILAKYVTERAKKAPKTAVNAFEEPEVTEMLSNNEIRSYVDMKPLNGFDEFVDEERVLPVKRRKIRQTIEKNKEGTK